MVNTWLLAFKRYIVYYPNENFNNIKEKLSLPHKDYLNSDN